MPNLSIDRETLRDIIYRLPRNNAYHRNLLHKFFQIDVSGRNRDSTFHAIEAYTQDPVRLFDIISTLLQYCLTKSVKNRLSMALENDYWYIRSSDIEIVKYIIKNLSPDVRSELIRSSFLGHPKRNTIISTNDSRLPAISPNPVNITPETALKKPVIRDSWRHINIHRWRQLHREMLTAFGNQPEIRSMISSELHVKHNISNGWSNLAKWIFNNMTARDFLNVIRNILCDIGRYASEDNKSKYRTMYSLLSPSLFENLEIDIVPPQEYREAWVSFIEKMKRNFIAPHDWLKSISEDEIEQTFVEGMLRRNGWDTELLEDVRRKKGCDDENKAGVQIEDYLIYTERSNPKIVIEVKRYCKDLSKKEALQAEEYAKRHKTDWYIVTNGREIRFYKTGAPEIPVFRINFESEKWRITDSHVKLLYLISKQQIIDNKIQTYIDKMTISTIMPGRYLPPREQEIKAQ